MNRFAISALAATVLVGRPALAQPADPRLREVTYDPAAVITVPVKRGVVTLVMLGADETISEVAVGLGGDCGKPEMVWCIAAPAGGRTLFVKPKAGARAPNNLAVVTDQRAHSFRFVVLADGDPKPPVYRLVVRAPAPKAPAFKATAREAPLAPALTSAVPPRPEPSPQQIVAERLRAKAQVMNTSYSIAEGANSQ